MKTLVPFTIIKLILYGFVMVMLNSCIKNNRYEQTPPALLPTNAIIVGGESITSSTMAVNGGESTPFPSVVPTLNLEKDDLSEIIVCIEEEPQTLYSFDTTSYVEELVLGAIYDGPIDHYAYEYEPVILTHLPTFENGDVQIISVPVNEGDIIFDKSTGALSFYDGPETVYQQMVVTFTLRNDIMWSDGQLMTAIDFQYAFEVLSHADTTKNKFEIALTSDYRAVGNFQIQWKSIPGYLTHNYLEFLMTPLPQHQLGNFDIEELSILPQSTKYPLGWGPFMVNEWVSGDHITLVRNPYYFRRPYPLVGKVIFRFWDFNQSIGSLTVPYTAKNQRCDIVVIHRYNDPYQGGVVEEMVKLNLVHAYVYPIAWDHMDFVFNNHLTSETLVDNPIFRQAILIAINPSQLVYETRFQALNGLIAAHHPLATQLHFRETYPYDPAMARALLDSLGIVDSDGDGFREQNNDPLTLRLAYVESVPMDWEIIPAIQSQLKEVGILVVPVSLAVGEFEALVKGERDLDIDLVYYPSPLTMFPLCQLYHTSTAPLATFEGVDLFKTLFPVNLTYLTGYSNDNYDQVCQVAQETVNFEDIVVAYEPVYDILTQDLPTIPLFIRTTFALARPEIGGFSPDGLQVETWNVEEWFSTLNQ